MSKHVIVRYKTRPDAAEENTDAAAGTRYPSPRVPEGVDGCPAGRPW